MVGRGEGGGDGGSGGPGGGGGGVDPFPLREKPAALLSFLLCSKRFGLHFGVTRTYLHTFYFRNGYDSWPVD